MKKRIAIIFSITLLFCTNLFSQNTAQNNIANGNANITLRATVKTTDDCNAASNGFFYVLVAIIYTIGQLLLLFLILNEKGFKNKKIVVECYTIVDGECLN